MCFWNCWPNIRVKRSKSTFLLTCRKAIYEPIHPSTKTFRFCVEKCPRYGQLKFRDLRPLTSFSRSRKPFLHFALSLSRTTPHQKSASQQLELVSLHTYRHTRAHYRITTTAIYTRCQNEAIESSYPKLQTFSKTRLNSYGEIATWTWPKMNTFMQVAASRK